MRNAWLPVVLLLGVALNLAQRDVEGTLGFVGMGAMLAVVRIPSEQRKLEVAAMVVFFAVVVAMLVPRLFDLAERL